MSTNLPQDQVLEHKLTSEQLVAKLHEALRVKHQQLSASVLETSKLNNVPPQRNPGPSKGAVKHDADKTDWAILPIAASEEIIKVFEFGAKKYARGNFKEGTGLAYTRVLNSLLRHTYAFMQGQDLDPETGLSHLAHAGCNIYMLLTYELNKDKFSNDDRASTVMK